MIIANLQQEIIMKSFNNNHDETAPWLYENKNDFLLFNNTYSCAQNTLSALKHALTKANYYNNKVFSSSFSIIDIAKKSIIKLIASVTRK